METTSYYFSESDKGLLRKMRLDQIIKVGEMTKLKDESMSPIYVDMRDKLTEAHPELLPPVGRAFAWTIHKIAETEKDPKPQVVIGVPDAAHPLAAATATMAALDGLPISCLVQRKVPKDHGTSEQKGKLIIGKPKTGLHYNLIDDVITTSASKRESIAVMEAEGFEVKRVLVFFDRQQGGGNSLIRDGYKFYAVFKLLEVGAFFLDEGLITSEQYDDVISFIETHQVE